MGMEFSKSCEFVKVDAELGLVFGFAAVSTINGEDYFDRQDQHIPENELLKAATDFALKKNLVGTDMHARDGENQPVRDGDIVFMFPLLADIAKSLNIATPMTGLLIAMKPSDATLEKFKSGEYTGFSIAGQMLESPEVVEA